MMGQTRGSSTLLPWTVTEETVIKPAAAALGPDIAAYPPPQPALSVIDRTSAVLFVHQSLMFECCLDANKLADALGQALALFPTLGCRATKDTSGEWVLIQPGVGAVLTIGTSTASLASLAPQPPPLLAPLANLGSQLFGHLPDHLADDTSAAALPLLEVALVAVQGGCILGLRVCHLVADFATVQGLLHHLARAYSGRPLTAMEVPVPATLLVDALEQLPPPPGVMQPCNYVPMPANIGEQLGALAAAPTLQGLRLHLPPARLAALKATAMTEAAAAAAAEAAGGEEDPGQQPAWVSTHDALIAWLWRMLASLPCHRGDVTAFSQPMDMRGRLAALAAEAYHSSGTGSGQGGQPPRWVYGNFAAGTLTPELDVAAMCLGEVALALRRTLVRYAAKFGPDVTLLAQGDASGTCRCSSLTFLPVLHVVEAVAAGRRPMMMASQVTLDYEADANFAGQLPVGVECTFGHVLLPVAYVQPVPPAIGGGVYIYLWLRPDEAKELAAAVAAERWPSAATEGTACGFGT